MPLTYSAPAVSITIKIIESFNIDPAPLLSKLGIDPKLIEDPNARFSYESIDKLWFEAVNIVQDPCFGLRAARFWHPSQMGALGYAWLTSSSMHTALKRLSRYMSILTEGATLEIDELDDILSVHLKYKSISKQQPTRTDSFMAMLLAMCQANCSEEFHPVAISFTHDAPKDTSAFYALFKCPIHFGCAENRFDISKKVADKHIITANPKLVQLSDQIIIETLVKLDKNNIVERVKLTIINELSSGFISETSVAESILMSQRTLQRRLEENGTSFKQLLNDTRQDLADKYLRDSSLTLQEISFMLGFSEISSFSRAFRRWTGLSPSSYRKKTIWPS